MVFQGSNVLNIKNRINSLSIESAFYIYISFNLINLVIHILGYYSYPMFAQFDYCLYLVKIGIVVFLRYLLHKKDFRFSLERKLFKAIIVLDAIELFISIFAYRYTHTYYIIVVNSFNNGALRLSSAFFFPFLSKEVNMQKSNTAFKHNVRPII